MKPTNREVAKLDDGDIISARLAVVALDHNQVEELHRLANESASNSVQYALACGAELLRVKAELGHGRFGEWCQGLTFTEQTARNYMRVARSYPNGKRVFDLPDISLRGLLAAVKADRKEARRDVVVEDATYATVKTNDLGALVARGMKFGCVMADPPWIYGNQSTRGATSDHYVGMTVDEIAKLPVGALAEENAHLHLWTTNAFLFDCQRIMSQWGFEYRSCYVWVKPQLGMGNYWRVSHEFMLFGVRGSLPFMDRSLRSWGEFRRGKHSAKPEEIRGLVEKASPGPRLELFGRRPAPGWVVWGNEIERTVFDHAVEELS